MSSEVQNEDWIPEKTKGNVLTEFRPRIDLKLTNNTLTVWVGEKQHAWVAIITGPSNNYTFERKFIASQKYGQHPDSGTARIYKQYPLEVSVDGEKRYFKFTGDDLVEIDEEEVYDAMHDSVGAGGSE